MRQSDSSIKNSCYYDPLPRHMGQKQTNKNQATTTIPWTPSEAEPNHLSSFNLMVKESLTQAQKSPTQSLFSMHTSQEDKEEKR